MPGPHLDLSIYQCFEDVGGVDIWLAQWWDGDGQWYVGWHLNGPSGVLALTHWSWPNPSWRLIGWEWWSYNPTHLLESWYQFPNPIHHQAP